MQNTPYHLTKSEYEEKNPLAAGFLVSGGFLSMKLFKHYKNKSYKYIGQAKHSETLEDMVIYETRYENELGKLWVRPKKMFFEPVIVNGASTPRFKEISLDIKETTQITENDIKNISVIIEKAFGEWDQKWFYSTYNSHNKFYLITAFIDSQPVAFKLGYESTQKEFYSWLGGVVPEYRGLGIAADLMKTQHEWCRKNGYKKIQTKTQNRFRDMLLLNIRFGFDIVGYQLSDEGGAKILLERNVQ